MLMIDREILQQLSTVEKQLNVVTIAGLYRTGKSYLLTRLAGKYKGFPFGSKVESKTKGIWSWCFQHPVHEEQMLLLLDTEGLGDVRKGDENNDNQLLVLATLLSSTLVYNTFGPFDQDALNKLTFITEMSNHIKISEEQYRSKDTESFDLVFPEFILALRDFTLELEADGKQLTTDEYLEYCLELLPGFSPNIKKINEPRQYIRTYFRKRTCFVFDTPTVKPKLKRLEELPDEDLSKEFVDNVKIFVHYILNECKPLSLENGIPVTGRMFASLLTNYIDEIREGGVPCIESALTSMAAIENDKAVEEAFAVYIAEMEKQLNIPTPDEKTLHTVHIRCKNAAFNVFAKKSVMDKRGEYKQKADKKINKAYVDYSRRNSEESQSRCKAALTDLRRLIDYNLDKDVYHVPGGYTKYREDIRNLKQNYQSMTDLGVKKQEMIRQFSCHILAEAESILKSDEKLKEKKKELELEQNNNDILREQMELYNPEYRVMHDRMLENEKQLEKEIQQLQEKNAAEIKYMEESAMRRIDEIEKLKLKHEKNIHLLTAKVKSIAGEKEEFQKQLEEGRKHSKADMELIRKEIENLSKTEAVAREIGENELEKQSEEIQKKQHQVEETYERTEKYNAQKQNCDLHEKLIKADKEKTKKAKKELEKKHKKWYRRVQFWD